MADSRGFIDDLDTLISNKIDTNGYFVIAKKHGDSTMADIINHQFIFPILFDTIQYINVFYNNEKINDKIIVTFSEAGSFLLKTLSKKLYDESFTMISNNNVFMVDESYNFSLLLKDFNKISSLCMLGNFVDLNFQFLNYSGKEYLIEIKIKGENSIYKNIKF